jgi:hypothetical protein
MSIGILLQFGERDGPIDLFVERLRDGVIIHAPPDQEGDREYEQDEWKSDHHSVVFLKT